MGEAETPQNRRGGGKLNPVPPPLPHCKSATADTPLICIYFTGPQEFDLEGY